VVGMRWRVGVPVFDDRWSWVHLALGLACPFVKMFNVAVYAVAVLLFVVYEVMDSGDLEEFVGDVCEFAVGYLLGDMVATLGTALGTSLALFVLPAAVFVAVAVAAVQIFDERPAPLPLSGLPALAALRRILPARRAA